MTYELPARRCRACGSDKAIPAAHLDRGLTRYIEYACPDCGATFKIEPPGAVAYHMVMAALALGVIGTMMFIYDRYDLMAWLGLAFAAYVVWQLYPFWRHPATGPAPAEAAQVGPREDDPDPVRQQLNRIDRMSPVRAALLPIAVVVFVLGTAAALGLINDLWLELWRAQ